MLEVDRQSGGFTPHALLNRVPSGCSTGVESLELFHWGSAIPTEGFFKKLHKRSVSGAFYVYSVECHLVLSKKNRT